jgi:uracil-DNA glycosylase
MAHLFDPGPSEEPFVTLCRDYPEAPVYPAADFRLEWGPVFHRGRLDGSARVLVIGQDPAQHEVIAHRILVGEAGHRLQGFLAKLGIDESYVLVNTFLYSVYGQGRGAKHKDDAAIVKYRNRWLDALFAPKKIEAVVALGMLADDAWKKWKQTPKGQAVNPEYVKITHPTQPESASAGNGGHAAAIKAMLANWNLGLQALHPLPHPDKQRALKLYGTSFKAGEQVEIPEQDLPEGSPDWMRLDDGWADRTGSGKKKRATITVTVPGAYVP